MTVATALEPIVKKLDLKCGGGKSFQSFYGQHPFVVAEARRIRCRRKDAETVKFEAKTGGRVYEIEKSGKEREWGRVLVCDAPNRLVFLMGAGSEPEKTTEVEVQFKERGRRKILR